MLMNTKMGRKERISLLVLLSVILGQAAAEKESTVQLLARQLKASNAAEWTSTASMYTDNSLADGQNADWDEYQQAWRYLGFMIDCENASHWDDDDANGGSGDYAYSDNQSCKRYVLWAAYVDQDYSGGGIGEYQFWDRWNNKWDDSPCDYASSGDGRCAKMDCHLPDTNWVLLGIFKHRQPDEWMGQLFKHEGVCIWSQEEYGFMKNARKAWPKGCAVSGSKTLTGGNIYYAIKPTSGGDITMGLYSDDACTQEYDGSVNSVLGNVFTQQQGSHDSGDYNIDYSNWSYKEALAYWKDAFDIFKICQPCVAYDLNNVGYNGGEKGSSYGTYTCDTDDTYGGQNADCANDDFSCYDDAGYENVNQCMKFRAKTKMDPATIRDVMLAHRQGTLVETLPLQGMEEPKAHFFHVVGRGLGLLVYFVICAFVFVQGVRYMRRARKDIKGPKFEEPLVGVMT